MTKPILTHQKDELLEAAKVAVTMADVAIDNMKCGKYFLLSDSFVAQFTADVVRLRSAIEEAEK